MPNSLDLGDEEFDLADVWAQCEDAFDIKLNRDDGRNLGTMGDWHDMLMRHLQGRVAGVGCQTMMAFLRLRRALAASSAGIVLRPGTRLDSIPHKSVKRLFAALGKRTGLRMPELQHGILGAICAMLIFAWIVGFAIVVRDFHWPVVAVYLAAALPVLAIMVMLQRLDPMQLPTGCKTLGDLARAVAAQNTAKLAAAGGRLDAKTVWDALLQFVQPHSDTDIHQIRRETTLLRQAASR
jgi:hypothetical protein